ncbi:MAG: EutN/CcmL family microcompartment protein [Planctomycetia bacterium]|nr:EutN/CcmL family microcompartment protein [Planctomycetia bacterium]
MRIGKVVGTVTLGTIHPSLIGGQLKIVVPFTFHDLAFKGDSAAHSGKRATELVVYDELSAGIGEWIALSEGAEASMPFYPNNKPIDAYAAAILDTVELDQEMMDRFK